MLREGEGIAARALTAVGITLDAARARIDRGDAADTGQIPFTPVAKQALELALRHALSYRHNYIGTEHMLLGVLAADGERLAQLGVDGDAVRTEVAAMLGGQPVEPLWDYAQDELSPTQPVDAILEQYRADGWEIVSVRIERRRKPGTA